MGQFRRWKTAAFWGVVLAITFVGSQAFALDAYESRRNVFGGLGVGGGYGFVHKDGELIEEGPGMQLQAVLGSGLTDRLTMGIEVDWWTRSVDKGEGDRYAIHHGSAGSVANFFLFEGLHLDGGLGFAYGVCDGVRRDDNCDWQELGLEAEGGFGYEFWITGNLAAGADFTYTHHFYSQTSFDTLSMVFNLRWY